MYLKIEIQNQGYELITLLRNPVMVVTGSLGVSGRFGQAAEATSHNEYL